MNIIKKFRLYIIILLSLATLYVTLKYTATYLITSSINNLLNTSVKNKVKLSDVSFDPVSLNLSIKSLNLDKNTSLDKLYIDFSFPSLIDRAMEFSALASVNEGEIALDGKFSSGQVDIEFVLKSFDLSLLNMFLDKERFGLGKIKGRFSSAGSFYSRGGEIKMKLDLNLQNVFLYSKDLKVINYFAKDLSIKELALDSNKSSLDISSSSFDIGNLILSIPSKDFSENRLSKFSKIEIGDIKINSDKKTLAISGLVNFSDGGFFSLNRYNAGDKMVMDVKVKAVDLAQFSSAFEPLLKYQIESGKISLNAKTSTGRKKVKGNVKINLSQINLDNKNEFGEKLENQSIMPLKTAIFMIQDDDGNIELDFDLSGDKNDPNFSVFGVLKKGAGSVAISKMSSIIATKMAVKFTPMLISSIPLSPSNIFMFANGAYKIVTKARFRDVEFEPLKDDIKDSSKKDLVTVVDFLKENKKIKLHVCPVASKVEFADDKISGDKVLLLANERVESLTEYFKGNNKSDILSQVIFCRPKISDDSNVGKAEISI